MPPPLTLQKLFSVARRFLKSKGKFFASPWVVILDDLDLELAAERVNACVPSSVVDSWTRARCGLVETERANGRSIVRVTPSGHALLEEQRTSFLLKTVDAARAVAPVRRLMP
jgi:hypothetical protein